MWHQRHWGGTVDGESWRGDHQVPEGRLLWLSLVTRFPLCRGVLLAMICLGWGWAWGRRSTKTRIRKCSGQKKDKTHQGSHSPLLDLWLGRRLDNLSHTCKTCRVWQCLAGCTQRCLAGCCPLWLWTLFHTLSPFSGAWNRIF